MSFSADSTFLSLLGTPNSKLYRSTFSFEKSPSRAVWAILLLFLKLPYTLERLNSKVFEALGVLDVEPIDFLGHSNDGIF